MVVRIIIKLDAKKKFIVELTDEQIQTATVKWLKKKIEFLEGTPVELQQLIYKEKQLEDSRLLQDYGLKHESINHMSLIICIRPVDPENEAGAMGGQSGENESEHKSAVEATDEHHKMFVRINIKLAAVGKFIIELTDERFQRATVECLKNMIEFGFGIPVEHQQLIYKRKQLEDSRLLQYYRIKDESLIHMRLKPQFRPVDPGNEAGAMGGQSGENESGHNCNLQQLKGGVYATEEHNKMVERINVKMLTGKTIVIQLTDKQIPRGTVKWLKTRIESLEGTPVDQQRLIHSGVLLEDFRLLSYYELKEESVIHVVLRLRGGGRRRRKCWLGLGLCRMGVKRGKNRSMEILISL